MSSFGAFLGRAGRLARSATGVQLLFVLGAFILVGGAAGAAWFGIDRAVTDAEDDGHAAVLVGQLNDSIQTASDLVNQESDRSSREPGRPTNSETGRLITAELDYEAQLVTQLSGLDGTGEAAGLGESITAARDSFRTFLRDQRPAALGTTHQELEEASATVDTLSETWTAAGAERQRRIHGAINTAVTVTLAALAAALMSLALAIWLGGRRANQRIAIANGEAARLREAQAVLERRTEQFRALYQVVTEITDTLSLKYVVQTAIHEARRLVGADVATLRLLHGERLDAAGEEREGGDEGVVPAEGVPADGVQADGVLLLGSGLTGRAAKRGKAFITNARASLQMAPAEMVEGMESGIVVPLIVGARVVGTISCWSRRVDGFDPEDQQVLEMMASQVATAVAAADSYHATEHLAHTDTLTDLPNRRSLAKDTAEHFQPALGQGRPLAVATIDIDHFKQFNDEFGHKTGDITLQKVAAVLRASLRDEDFIYRYGGEEFTVVFEDVSPGQAMQMLERLRLAVERTPITGEALQPVGPVTVSMGVAFSSADESFFDHLLKLADSALYESKRSGRNRLTPWMPEADRDGAVA